MSTTIDQKIVEMRFDNRQFESGVSTTMSTLDKLKRSLNLDGASKGLENINSAAKKVDMNGLGNAVETVRARFSALDVVGVTALANITNSAVNAGKRMISALTIDPIKTGFQEYETQMNAVQTILANTQSKGSTLDDVNKALDTLNTYADKTIYNFTEMTRNIGTFTAAGVDLQTSVDSIKGIANLAAVSGSSSQQASTAMYQLSQALAAGRVSLMDWNSVVNAGMGGELFQNALIRTSELLKTGAKDAINTYGSFRESLTKGEWLTTEVLTETLKQISGAYTEAELIAQGFTKEQAKEIAQLAETADNAATKVKTFSQLWEVMKESAQSGWAQTWKIIIGDFEEAKNLLTPLADFFTGIIGKMNAARNDLLESALGRGIGNLAKKINGLLEPAKGAAKAVTSTVDAVADLGKMADKVINGDFGNGKDRFDALTKAGYNYYRIQNKVNETLGNSFRHSEEVIAKQDKLLGKQGEATKKTKEQTTETTKLTDAQKNQLKQLVKMTEEQAREKGYTDEQIKSLRELGEQAEKLGVPLDEFIDNLDEINGRWLLINSFKNIGKGLISLFHSIKDAWVEVFPPKSLDERAEGLFNLIAAFSRFTNGIRTSLVESGDEIARTFKGVFAAIDIVLTVVGGPLKIAFKALTQILGMFDLNIWDVTAAVGDAIVKFRDWIDSTLDFTKVFKDLASPIKNGIKSFREWIETLKTSENLPKDIADGIMAGLGKVAEFIGDLFASVKKSIIDGFNGAPGDMISGFVNGVWTGISTIGQVLVELGKAILAKFREVLGIHSPSTETHSDGMNFMAGFLNGLKESASGVWEYIKAFGGKCLEVLGNIDWGALLAAGTAISALAVFWKIANTIEALTDPIEGFGEILQSAAKVVKSFSGVLNGIAMNLKAEALKGIAIAIAILAASIVVLTLVDPDRLWAAVGVIAVIGVVLTTLAVAIGKIGNAASGVEGIKQAGTTIGKFALIVISISGAMLMIALAAKVFANMSWDDLGKAGLAVAAISGIIVGLIAATKLVGKDADKIGNTLLKISAAIAILAIVAKTLANMSWDELAKAGVGLGGLVAIITLLTLIPRIAGNGTIKLGTTLMQIAGAIAILVITAKLLASMTWAEMGKAAVGLLGFVTIISLLTLITRMADPSTMYKLGSTMMLLSGAIAILAISAKLLASMTWAEMGKAAVGILALGGIITGLIAATKLAKGRLKQVGSTLLMLSASILLLSIAAALLGTVSIEGLTKGIIAVGLLGSVMALMIASTKGAKNCYKNLVAMAVAIATMSVSAALLAMVDKDRLIESVSALSVMMGMFAVMTAATKNVTQAMGSLIVLTAAIAVMAGALYLLTTLSPEKVLDTAIGLSAVMLAVSGSLLIVSKIGNNAKGIVMGILALTAMAIPLLAFVGVLAVMNNVQGATQNALILAGLATVMTALLIPLTIIGLAGPAAFIGAAALLAMAVPLIAFVGVLAVMQNVQNAVENARVLSELAIVMTVLLIPLTIIGAFGPAALIGVLALAAMAVPLLAFVGVLAIMQSIQSAEENAKLLIALMDSMSTVLMKVAIVGPLALMGVTGLAALTVLMLGVGALAVAVGALMTKFPAIQQFLDTGVPILGQLANAVGIIVGNLIDGFMNAATQSLPEIGTRLSEFMTNLAPFIDGVKMVDASVLTGVGILTAAIVALTVADLLSGVSAFLQGGSSLADLGTELSMFMANVLPFVEGASVIDPAMMDGVKSIAQTILLLTGANILEGLTSWLTGGSSLTSFSSQLPQLGSDLASFAANLGTFDESKVLTVNCAANAIKAIAEAAESLPNEGGWLGKIVGENDMGAFGQAMPALASNLVTFADNLGTFDEARVSTITCACDAIKVLAEAAGELPNDGGWLGKIVGENNVGVFGAQLPQLATDLTGFVTNLGTFTDEQVSTVSCAANAIKVLAESAGELPNDGGWLGKIVGENDIATFGDKLPALGENLSGFVDNLGTFTDSQVSTIKSATSAIKVIADIGELKNPGDITSFGKKLATLGEKLSSFVSSINDVGSSSVDRAVSCVKDIVAMATEVADVSVDSLKTFGNSLKKYAEDGVDGFVDAFSEKKAVASAKSNAKALVTAACDAIKTSDNKQKFYNAGSYLVDGFKNGISENTYKAEAKAKAMAKAAANAAKKELDEHSPSRVFYQIGAFAGQGFVNALSAYGQKSYEVGSEVANLARSGLAEAVNKIKNVIDSDMDTQPTIRPVLDLSDVRAGANTIGGMFGLHPSVGVLANVGAISASMNQRNQNGVNDDVVLAINKLRKDMSNMDRPSYNINGITYDDGSNVSEAIKVLVREIKLGRRS